MDVVDNLFIVGAGFSLNAGLPLAGNFTNTLLSYPSGGATDRVLVDYLKTFVNETFGAGKEVAAEDWPPLEDIFTTIDLAANTGHHLGRQFSPSTLRTVRRVLIVRFTRMLRMAYNDGLKRSDRGWQALEEFLSSIIIQNSTFLSMNWDTVVEGGLSRTQGVEKVDYGCGAQGAEFRKDGSIAVRGFTAKSPKSIQILKPHGSLNWMYCDSCSRLFWFDPSQTLKIASRLFKPSDRNVVESALMRSVRQPSAKASCPRCQAEAMGTRFATFSYRKALDFPMHSATWRKAVSQLRSAKNWIFIGYSMPPADYEFKFLLKRFQLARTTPPRIFLITGGSDADDTVDNYSRFFGRSNIPSDNVMKEGLSLLALKRLRTVGALAK